MEMEKHDNETRSETEKSRATDDFQFGKLSLFARFPFEQQQRGKAEVMRFEYKNVRLCMEANKLLTNC